MTSPRPPAVREHAPPHLDQSPPSMSHEPSTPLAKVAMTGDFKQLEEQWMAAVERGDRELDDYYHAADIAVASGRSDVAGPLLSVVLEALANEEPTDENVDFALRAALLGIFDAGVRRHAAAIHDKADRPAVSALLGPITGSPNESTRERISLCLQLTPGRYVSGTERFGPERVERFDVGEGVFVLTDGESERSLTPEAAGAELSLLPADDFRAQLRFEVDALVERAQKDPAGLVSAALRSSKNRLEWQDLKKLMARGVVAPNAFARWWNKAKGLVERDPMIQVYGEKQPTLILRDEPISHEAELRGKLDLAATEADRVQLVLGYLASIDQGHGADPAFLGELAELLLGMTRDTERSIPKRLLCASVFDDVAARMDPAPEELPPYAELVAGGAEMTDVVTELEDEDSVRRALFLVRKHGNEVWPSLFARTLPQAPGRLTESLAKELLDADRGAELGAAIQAILKTPERCGDGLFWLFKAATSRADTSGIANLDPPAIALALLRLMNRWARSARSQFTAAQKNLLLRMRNAFAASDYRVMEQLADRMNDVQAKATYDAIKDNLGLNDANRHRMETILIARHEEAILGKKELWEQDAIYVSPAGLRQRQGEFDNIVNVEMVKNSAAIGHAAGFGDLSENAEFTAALEQRDFLSRRANEIGQELRKAVLIPEDVSTETVNVGMQITVRDTASGHTETLTFLGPWDVDLDNGVYSYLAPFSKAFMGKKVGEVVAPEGGDPRQLEIVKIDRAELPN